MSHSHLPRQVRAAGRFASAGGQEPRAAAEPPSETPPRAGTDLAVGCPANEDPAPQSGELVGGAHWHPDPQVVGAGRRLPAVPQRLIPARGRQAKLRGPCLEAREGGARRAPTGPRRSSGAGARAAAARGGRQGGWVCWGARAAAAAAAAAASACCSACAACSRRSAPARRLPSGHGRRGVRGVESADPGPASRTVTVPVSGGEGGGDTAGTLRDGSAGRGQPSGDSEVLCGSRP